MSLDFMLYIDVDTGGAELERVWLCDENITHNLNTMAGEAGIYECLWRPDENGFTQAKDIIEPLSKGLKELKARPSYFTQFEAENGWGLYEHFVPFVQRVLDAAEKHPNANIYVSR